VDPERLPDAYRNIIRTILHLPGKLDHVKRLVRLGVEFDRPDAEGLTPVQVAGWEGLPDVMAYLLSLGPDLAHQNGYGGTLLSTILHGSGITRKGLRATTWDAWRWRWRQAFRCRGGPRTWQGSPRLPNFLPTGARGIRSGSWRAARSDRAASVRRQSPGATGAIIAQRRVEKRG
jgi:ankyrin repeat protein